MSFRTTAAYLICSAMVAACSSDSPEGSTITVEDVDMAADFMRSLEERGIPFDVMSETSITVPDDRFWEASEALRKELGNLSNVGSSGTGRCLTIEAVAGRGTGRESNVQTTSCAEKPDI